MDRRQRGVVELFHGGQGTTCDLFRRCTSRVEQMGPHMSVVDLLFNAGPKSKVILNRGESLSET